jgi:hypothetical protein
MNDEQWAQPVFSSPPAKSPADICQNDFQGTAMLQSTANYSLLFLRALIFSAILVGPVIAFAASYESRSPSNGGIGLVLLVSLQRV